MEKKAKIISVIGRKGGPGKTTVSLCLGEACAEAGLETLVIDTDEDGTSMDWSRNREGGNEKPPVVSMPDAKVLKTSIPALIKEYDVIVIDGSPHPSIDEMVTVSVAVSDLLVIPVIPSPNDVWKLRKLVQRVNQAKKATEKIAGKSIDACFAVNKVVAGTRLGQEIDDALSGYGYPVLDTRFHFRQAYPDSFGQGITPLKHSDKKAQAEVLGMFGEVADRLGLNSAVSVLKRKMKKEKVR
jgi:chromosome partitioning protein